jgi:hypothetical protein
MTYRAPISCASKMNGTEILGFQYFSVPASMRLHGKHKKGQVYHLPYLLNKV